MSDELQGGQNGNHSVLPVLHQTFSEISDAHFIKIGLAKTAKTAKLSECHFGRGGKS
jgi:hypothetical protein